MKYLSLIINILLGGLFVLSAYSKLFPVEYFELELVDQNITSWYWSPFLARLIIAFEFFLGLALIFQLKARKVSLPFTLAFLGILSVYLLIILFINGNQENCGCYGELIPLSTVESLIKNIVLIGITYLGYRISKKNSYAIFSKRIGSILFIVLMPLSLISVVILNPPIDIYQEAYTSEFIEGEALMIQLPDNQEYPNEFFVVFVSSECGHCKRVKRKFDVARRKYPNFPEAFFFIEGDDEAIDSFMTNSEQGYLYKKVTTKELLGSTHGHFPMVIHVKKGKITRIQNSGHFLKETFD